MTIINPEEIKCANCGNESEHLTLTSTNQFGSPDLDLRPAPMARDTMYQWVLICPECGYASSDISEIDNEAMEIIRSDAYQQLRNKEDVQELSLRFELCAYLNDEMGNADLAAEDYLRAAWDADDNENNVRAKEMRQKAASCFTETINEMNPDDPDIVPTKTRLSDVFRRSEQWDKAIALADDVLSIASDETIVAVAKFERTLASNKDGRCYKIEDAMGEKDDSYTIMM